MGGIMLACRCAVCWVDESRTRLSPSPTRVGPLTEDRDGWVAEPKRLVYPCSPALRPLLLREWPGVSGTGRRVIASHSAGCGGGGRCQGAIVDRHVIDPASDIQRPAVVGWVCLVEGVVLRD